MNPKQGKYGVTLSGMYYQYKSKLDDIDKLNGADVDYSTYCSVIREFNNKLAGALISEALEFNMPFRLGRVRIKKFRQKIELDENGDIDKKNLPVNWKKTKELWCDQYPGLSKDEIKKIPGKQVIYHLNEHTSGYRCKLYWDHKKSSNIKNNRAYSAMFTFSNRRKLASMLKTDCKINYYE
jgi:hypothetical protein